MKNTGLFSSFRAEDQARGNPISGNFLHVTLAQVEDRMMHFGLAPMSLEEISLRASGGEQGFLFFFNNS